MKRIPILILTFLSVNTRSQVIPKDTLLIIGDSILIGNCFVNIKNASSVYCVCDSLLTDHVYVAHYKDSVNLPLSALQYNFNLVSPDTSLKIFDGNIALIKPNRSRESIIYTAIFYNYEQVTQADVLETGDLIVFLCVRAFKNRKLYNFATTWYYIR